MNRLSDVNQVGFNLKADGRSYPHHQQQQKQQSKDERNDKNGGSPSLDDVRFVDLTDQGSDQTKKTLPASSAFDVEAAIHGREQEEEEAGAVIVTFDDIALLRFAEKGNKKQRFHQESKWKEMKSIWCNKEEEGKTYNSSYSVRKIFDSSIRQHRASTNTSITHCMTPCSSALGSQSFLLLNQQHEQRSAPNLHRVPSARSSAFFGCEEDDLMLMFQKFESDRNLSRHSKSSQSAEKAKSECNEPVSTPVNEIAGAIRGEKKEYYKAPRLVSLSPSRSEPEFVGMTIVVPSARRRNAYIYGCPWELEKNHSSNIDDDGDSSESSVQNQKAEAFDWSCSRSMDNNDEDDNETISVDSDSSESIGIHEDIEEPQLYT